MGNTSFVDHEGELFGVFRANWGWSELAIERCSRLSVEDGDGRHEPVALVPLRQHHTVKVEAVVAPAQPQSKCFIVNAENSSIPVNLFVGVLIRVPAQCNLSICTQICSGWLWYCWVHCTSNP